jgi:hypothetical protein
MVETRDKKLAEQIRKNPNANRLEVPTDSALFVFTY